jgi:hypothetical protein
VRCWGTNSLGQVMLLGFVFEMQGCACSLLDLTSRCELPQLGDSSTTGRLTPVGVAGLSSGVSSVSLGGVLGGVRLTFALFAVAARDYSQPLLVFMLLVCLIVMMCDAGCCAHAHACCTGTRERH